MSESDVHRRQILTYKDGPSAERVKSLLSVDKITDIQNEISV